METITERLKRDHDERSRDRHDRVTRTVSIVSAIIAGCALLLTSYQIWTIRDNAQRQMRAYVFAKLTTHKYPPQNSDRLGIGFEIKNSGLTWARNLVIRKAKIPRVFNVEYDPWTRAQWDAAGLPMVLWTKSAPRVCNSSKFGSVIYPILSMGKRVLISPFG